MQSSPRLSCLVYLVRASQFGFYSKARKPQVLMSIHLLTGPWSAEENPQTPFRGGTTRAVLDPFRSTIPKLIPYCR
ncbi:hypothetical protein V2G26_011043 [Clonostachys chloroleuca]